MSDEITTTATPPAPTAPPAVPDATVETANAVERHRARLAAASAGAAEPATQQPTPPVPPPADEIEIDVPDEQALLEEARKRKAEQAQRVPYEQLASKLAEIERALGQLPTGPAISVAALATGDAAARAKALREAGIDPAVLQRELTRAQLGPDPAQLLEQAIERKLAPLFERIEQLRAPTPDPATATPELADLQSAYASYIEGAGNRPDWPHLSELRDTVGAKALTQLVTDYVFELQREGVDTSRLTDEQISSMYERRLAGRRASRPNGSPINASGVTSQPQGAPSASGGPTKTGAPRSVTNGLAASAAPPRQPETDEEAHRLAVERHRARLSKQPAA